MMIINAPMGSFATNENSVMKRFQDVRVEKVIIAAQTTAFVQLQTLQQIQPFQQVQHPCQRLFSQRLFSRRLCQLMSRRLFQLSSRRLCKLPSLHLCKLPSQRQPHKILQTSRVQLLPHHCLQQLLNPLQNQHSYKSTELATMANLSNSILSHYAKVIVTTMTNAQVISYVINVNHSKQFQDALEDKVKANEQTFAFDHQSSSPTVSSSPTPLPTISSAPTMSLAPSHQPSVSPTQRKPNNWSICTGPTSAILAT